MSELVSRSTKVRPKLPGRTDRISIVDYRTSLNARHSSTFNDLFIEFLVQCGNVSSATVTTRDCKTVSFSSSVHRRGSFLFSIQQLRIETILRSFGFERQYDKNSFAQIQWMSTVNSSTWNSFQDGKQLINHIQGEEFFATKLQLYQSLETYCKVNGSMKFRTKFYLDLDDIVPQTFKIDEKQDRLRFLEIFQDGQMWISKPSEMNRGEGICLIRNRSDLDEIIERKFDSMQREDLVSRRSNMKRIIQKYIERPLLINKKKFDLRCYLLISSVDPLMVFYHRGYIRLSMFDFDINEKNIQVHLTNQSIQKHDHLYKEKKETTIMTIDEFNQYLNDKVERKQLTSIEKNWSIECLQNKIERILLNVIESIRMRLKRRVGSFGLYGFDLMVDESFRVWLIEINVNPSLSTTTSRLDSIIPQVVRESIGLSMEIFDKVRRFEPIHPIRSINEFRLIFDESKRKEKRLADEKNLRRSMSLHRSAQRKTNLV